MQTFIGWTLHAGKFQKEKVFEKRDKERLREQYSQEWIGSKSKGIKIPVNLSAAEMKNRGKKRVLVSRVKIQTNLSILIR